MSSFVSIRYLKSVVQSCENCGILYFTFWKYSYASLYFTLYYIFYIMEQYNIIHIHPLYNTFPKVRSVLGMATIKSINIARFDGRIFHALIESSSKQLSCDSGTILSCDNSKVWQEERIWREDMKNWTFRAIDSDTDQWTQLTMDTRFYLNFRSVARLIVDRSTGFRIIRRCVMTVLFFAASCTSA